MSFISIEGCDGTGKSTQAKKLQEKLANLGHQIFLTKEPGGSPLGEMIRSLLLNNEIKDPLTELLLISSARRDHVQEMKKEMAKGKIVITDRFSDSSLAYQGYAKGLELHKISFITDLATDGFMPDLTILLDLDLQLLEERIAQSRKHNNFYDKKGLAFHEKVKEGFLQIAKIYPERIIVLDANKSREDLSDEILEIVLKRL
jgi:dTMP kinase